MLFRRVCFHQWSWKVNYKCGTTKKNMWHCFVNGVTKHIFLNVEGLENINLRSNTTPLASKSHVRVPVVSLGRLCSTECLWKQVTVDINSLCTAAPLPPQKKIGDGASGHLRHEYLIKYAYFDKILLRMICFYQWSWKLNYKCSLMALAIWDILEPQMFVTWLIIENYHQNIYSKMGKG